MNKPSPRKQRQSFLDPFETTKRHGRAPSGTPRDQVCKASAPSPASSLPFPPLTSPFLLPSPVSPTPGTFPFTPPPPYLPPSLLHVLPFPLLFSLFLSIKFSRFPPLSILPSSFFYVSLHSPSFSPFLSPSVLTSSLSLHFHVYTPSPTSSPFMSARLFPLSPSSISLLSLRPPPFALRPSLRCLRLLSPSPSPLPLPLPSSSPPFSSASTCPFFLLPSSSTPLPFHCLLPNSPSFPSLAFPPYSLLIACLLSLNPCKLKEKEIKLKIWDYGAENAEDKK